MLSPADLEVCADNVAEARLLGLDLDEAFGVVGPDGQIVRLFAPEFAAVLGDPGHDLPDAIAFAASIPGAWVQICRWSSDPAPVGRFVPVLDR